jgi:hypothetical protein
LFATVNVQNVEKVQQDNTRDLPKVVRREREGAGAADKRLWNPVAFAAAA